MILNTKEFQNICKTILLAVDKTAGNLGLDAKGNTLKLSVTNGEYYAAAKFNLTEEAQFKATVSAKQFLDLIAGITTDTFELIASDKNLVIKAGKSKYTLAQIYENDKIMELPMITIDNKSVEMIITNDILTSILNVNSKELLKKDKAIDNDPLAKLYYITEEGCFTRSTGACLNTFTLEKPVKFALNDRIVKLFKLFNTDVNFALGHDTNIAGNSQTKVVFETETIYLAAVITEDATVFNKIQGPYNATKKYISEVYTNHLVLNTNKLNGALTRLLSFNKNASDSNNSNMFAITLTAANNELSITDSVYGNVEVVQIENGSFIDGEYTMGWNLYDAKLILDACKEEFITINCGSHRAVVFNRGNVSNLIPEI